MKNIASLVGFSLKEVNNKDEKINQKVKIKDHKFSIV